MTSTNNTGNNNTREVGFLSATNNFQLFKPSEQKVICTPEVSLYQYNNNQNHTQISNNNNMVPNPKLQLGGAPLNPMSHEMDNSSSPISPSPSSMPTIIGGSLNNNINNSAMSTTSGLGGFQCGFCGKNFQQKNTFQNHLRSHRDVNGPDAYQCDICNKTFAVPARLTRHYRTHTGEKPYQCEYCNKSFSVKENLSVHRRIHTKERPYKCEVCERAFEHSGKLHRHMRIHTGERPHQCQVCQKTFIQSGQLVIHMRTHTGEKPYVCKVCNKGFTCSKQLKVHTRTHTGEKPYSCEICGKSFGYNHVLKLHQVAHYGEKVYKCTLCNSTFNSKKALETHIKTHSGGDSSPNTMDSDIAIVPEQRILHSPSSSLASVTPIHSDKENRELSDSDMSSSQSQNSPLSSSPAPRVQHSIEEEDDRAIYILPNISPPPSTYHSKSSNGHQQQLRYQFNNNHSTGNNSVNNQLPYPMLPPSVQVHQAPQSRTTFLYVTSKLPQHNSNSSSSSSLSSSGDQVAPTSKNNNNLNFKTFGFNTNDGNNGNGKPSFDERDKHFIQSASIRDKVLASIEKFGYGINNCKDLEFNTNTSRNEQKSNNVININNNGNVNSNHYNSFNNLQQRPTTISRNSIPENLTITNNNNINGIGKNNSFVSKLRNNNNNNNNNEHVFTPYSRNSSLRTIAMMKDHQQSQRSVISPLNNNQARGYNNINNKDENSNDDDNFDRLKSMYPSGGVLALALTRGSKVAASQLVPQSISVTPIINNNNNNSSTKFSQNNNCAHYYSVPSSPSPPPPPQSPQELCIDFSRRQEQNIIGHRVLDSATPSPPPRQSSPSGYSEGSYEELSDECHEVHIIRNHNRPSAGAGPRKRSSLILEKYAQENVPSSSNIITPPTKSESILSQRLRLSSVIQYAEKCT